MLKQSILLVTLGALTALGLACGGSPATQPPAAAGPTATLQGAAPTSVPGAAATKPAAPYPVVTPTASAPAAAAPTATLPPAQAAATSVPAAPAATAAPGGPYPVLKDGLALMSERCTACHNLARLQSARKSRAEWGAFVTEHKAKGIQLTDAETAILVDFLAATYK